MEALLTGDRAFLRHAYGRLADLRSKTIEKILSDELSKVDAQDKLLPVSNSQQLNLTSRSSESLIPNHTHSFVRSNVLNEENSAEEPDEVVQIVMPKKKKSSKTKDRNARKSSQSSQSSLEQEEHPLMSSKKETKGGGGGKSTKDATADSKV